MSAHELLDQHCAPGKGPVRIGSPIPWRLRVDPMDPQWLADTADRWWSPVFKGDLKKEGVHRVGDMIRLRDALVAAGGDSACMPALEEDLDKILDRGQFWPGRGAIRMPGERSRCHSNACALWGENQDRDVFVATGYALSDDGMWRQHSWALLGTERGMRVVETTKPRVLYFGFAMTLEETIEFCDNNLDFPPSVLEETRERYAGLDAAQPAPKRRAARR